VIDVETNNILGYVVAISAGSAYLIPLMDLFKQILQDRNPNTPISVPSPFRLLISLARYYFAAEPYGYKPLSDYYASEALSPEVLNRPSSDNTIQLLRSAVANGEDKNLLVRIICSIPADLWSALESFSTWPFEHQHNIDRDLTPVLVRMQNRAGPAGPAIDIHVTLSSPTVDTEKEKKVQGNLTSTDPPFPLM
jgi:hypothetical protein